MLWHRQAIFESKGDKLSSSDECRIRAQGLRHRIGKFWHENAAMVLRVTPKLGILEYLELDWLKLWGIRLGDGPRISLWDAYYLVWFVWAKKVWAKSFTMDIQQAPGRTWNPVPHFVLRTGCEQASQSDTCSIFRVKKTGQMWKLDRDCAFHIVGFAMR